MTASMDGLQERFRSIGLTDTHPSPSDRVSLQQRRAVSTPVPRYLFRVFTQHSDGSTDRNWVKSKDFVAGLASAAQDVFDSTTPQDTAKNIWGHLKWKGLANDNLMSWTSSLLFAIQYIFYRHADTRDRSDFRDINILVVDTTGLPEGALIRDIDLINAFSRHDENLANLERLRNSRYYFGEYLSQGAIDICGRSEVVSAQDMFDTGLLELRDEFRQSYATSRWEWANKVLELREAYTPPMDVLRNVSPQQIKVACTVGRLFGRKFRLPIGFQLTAICSGCLKVGIVAPAFEDESFTDEERESCEAGSSEMMEISSLPELVRARLTADIIYASYCQSKLKASLEEAEGNLLRARRYTEALEVRKDELQQYQYSQALERAEGVSLLSKNLELLMAEQLEIIQY